MDKLDGIIAKLLGKQILQSELTKADLPDFEANWRKWVPAFFPQKCTKPFSDEHELFWEWLWSCTQDASPRPYALCIPRGHGKSTIAEIAVVMMGALGLRDFCLYICQEEKSAAGHLLNIAALIESPIIQRLYPELGTPQIGVFGNQRGWTQTELRCANGFTVRAIGLEQSIRGVNVEGKRVGAFVFDDIDKISDSPETVAKKLQTIGKDILPTRGDHPIIIFVQNAIHRNSVMMHIMDRRTGVLSTAIRRGPVKAFRNLVWERDPENSARGILISGEPTWIGFDLALAQEDVDHYGIENFLTECQQEMSEASQGAIYPAYREDRNIITHSDFRRFFGDEAWDSEKGRLRIPDHGEMAVGLDCGTTVAHPTVVGYYWRPGESKSYLRQDVSDCIIQFGEIHAPQDRAAEAAGFSPRDLGDLIHEFEAQWDVRRRRPMRIMSHEQSSVQQALKKDLPADKAVAFAKNSCGRIGGIAVVQAYLTPEPREHPFVLDPDTDQPLMERPRLFILVPDEQGEFIQDGPDGEWRRRGPKNSDGMKRIRDEMPKYHYPSNLALEEKPLPHPLYNDAVDQQRYVFDYYGPPLKRLGAHDRALRELEKIAPHLTSASVQSINDDHKHSGAAAAQEILLNKLLREESKPKNLNLGSFLRRNRRK